MSLKNGTMPLRRFHSLCARHSALYAASLILLLAALPQRSPAQAHATLAAPHVTVSLLVPPAQIYPGQSFTAGLDFSTGRRLARLLDQCRRLRRASHDPTGSCLPGVTAAALQFPPPKRLPLGPLMDFGYEDEVVFPIPDPGREDATFNTAPSRRRPHSPRTSPGSFAAKSAFPAKAIFVSNAPRSPHRPPRPKRTPPRKASSQNSRANSPNPSPRPTQRPSAQPPKASSSTSPPARRPLPPSSSLSMKPSSPTPRRNPRKPRPTASSSP